MTNQTRSRSHTLQASTSNKADIELSKVRSFDKQTELYNVLHSEDPDHYSRLWMAGFLKFVGYTIEEICDIIDKEASWNDYSVIMTYNQVRSIFRGSNDVLDISLQVGKGFGENRSLEGFPHLSEYWIAKSNKREHKNREKFKNDWDEYKKYKLSSHKKEWFGEFIESDLCVSCGKSVVGWFNLHVHHLSYNPNKTCFIHALCHNHGFSIAEKIRRSEKVESEYGPKHCVKGSTRITCFYKKCESCTFEIIERGKI